MLGKHPISYRWRRGDEELTRRCVFSAPGSSPPRLSFPCANSHAHIVFACLVGRKEADMLAQPLLDLSVVVGMFLVRVVAPAGLMLAACFWVKRKCDCATC